MAHFYAHLVDIESLTVELDKLSLEDHHRKDLAEILDTMIHQTVMDVVLSNLSKEDQHQFVHKLKTEDPKDVMKFLNERVANIEDQIHDALKELKKDLHSDINETHRMIGKVDKKTK